MAKFYGEIGFAITEEVSPGIWKEQIEERSYYGDFVKRVRRLETANQINDNINLINDISIVADPFANLNYSAIRYLTYMGTKWRISNVEIQYPRLILSVGGVYNERSN